jgi:beta-lactamase regulating signal transducer with metallopeptidase domain
MNIVGLALGRSVLAVTLVTFFALVLERWASGRGPRAGSWVATASLLLVVAVTLAAFCPLPRRLDWQRLTGIRVLGPQASVGLRRVSIDANPEHESARRTSTAGEGAREGGTPWPALLRGLRRGLTWGSESVASSSAMTARAWLVIWIAGASLSLFRLVIGLWGVHDCRRRSKPVTDPWVLDLVKALGEAAGRRRTIELRELPSGTAATAATVGWLRPIVLLPADRQGWNELELRAVLAHEIAHVVRADYAAGLAAQMSLALHFYHPLVHWITARLQLQQELAADAQAAQLTGGRHGYLLALARLALRTETSRLAWPARTFLPARGQLIRRIHMLRQNASAKDRPLPAAWRALVISVLVGAGLGVIALRGQSPARAAVTPPAEGAHPADPATNDSPNSQSDPFDLAYMPANPNGIFAVRPAAIFTLPGMKTKADLINGILDKEFAHTLPAIEMIEQASTTLNLVPRERSKNQPGRIMTGAFTVRTVRDFDWKPACKQFAKLGPGKDLDLVEIHFHGKTYYRITGKTWHGRDACLYLPDSRTVVHSNEEHIRNLIDGTASRRPDLVTGDDWRKAERGLLACALDNLGGRWTLDAESGEPEDLPIAPLVQSASRWIFGVDHVDRLTFRAIGTCGSSQDPKAVAKFAESFLTSARSKADAANLTAHSQTLRVMKDLIRTCRVHQAGNAIDLTAECVVPDEDLAAFLADLVFF